MECQAATYGKLVPLHEADEQVGIAQTTMATLGNREDSWQQRDSGMPFGEGVAIVGVEALNHRRVRPCRAGHGDSAPVEEDPGALGVRFLGRYMLPDDPRVRRDRTACGDRDEIEQAALSLGDHVGGKIAVGLVGEEIENRPLRMTKWFAHGAALALPDTPSYWERTSAMQPFTTSGRCPNAEP